MRHCNTHRRFHLPTSQATQLKLSAKIWVLLVPILLTVIVACFGYRDNFGEPDMSIVGMGIVYGANWGDRLAGHLQYGMTFSFGYYQVLYLLMQDSAMRDPVQVARTINAAGLGFALLFALNLGLMLNRLLAQRSTALFILIAFVFCPISLPFLASGHPFIGACAFLFLSCWFALLSLEQPLPQQVARLLAAFLSMLFGLTLRGDVALALPFVLAAAWACSGHLDNQQRRRQLAAVAVMLGLAFLAFLVLQRPYASNAGGAAGSLATFAAKFIALSHVAKGVVLLVMAFGLLSVPVLGWTLYKSRSLIPTQRPMLLVWLVLLLPSLAFWLPNPQPARHFLLPILAMFGIIGTLAEHYLHDTKRAVLLGFVLAAGNQAAAELARPLIVRTYQWSYPAEGLRRATQQTPVGFFPLDQAANRLAQERAQQEAAHLAASQPRRLLVLSDAYEYMATALMVADPTLRASKEKVGNFEALLLSNDERRIYFIIKRFFWPGDTLAAVLKLPEYADYTIYAQPSTMSRYDHTPVPPGRAHQLP